MSNMEAVCVEQIERNHFRLINNRMLELRRQFFPNRPRKGRQEVMSLRQNLFGSASMKENLGFAQEELAKATLSFSQRWNFEVDAGEPKDGSYHWELIQGQQELGATGRLTCLTALSSADSSLISSKPKITATSPTVLPSSSPSSSGNKKAVTTTTFSTTTTPTAVISNKKCVKRLQKNVANNNKVPKLITDYFRVSKGSSPKNNNKSVDLSEERDSMSNRVVEILKIRSMNVR